MSIRLYITIVMTLFLAAMALTSVAEAKMTRIAVIDSGFNPTLSEQRVLEKLCKDGHYDFDLESNVVGFDIMGHGTYVTNIISKQIGKEKNDYCFLVYKVFGLFASGKADAVARAITKAVVNKATVINMSLEIQAFQEYDRRAMKFATKKGVKIFLASGNSGANLNVYCNSFPGCFKGINMNNLRIIGALDKYGHKTIYSNFGWRVTAYELGDYEGVGRGTSFAAPVALGKYVNDLEARKKK